MLPDNRPSRLLAAHVLATYAFLYTPILVLIAYSFNRSKRNAVWQGLTLDWYRELLSSEEVWGALSKSLQVACLSTLLATVLGTLAALAMARYRFRGRELLEAALHVPMLTPEVVLGVSLLALFVAARVTLGFGTLVLAHAAMSTTFVTVAVRARLAGYDATLDEAAADLGASPLTTLMHVTLPLIAPGVLAGAMLAFTLSFDDFVISFFCSGAGCTTLPVKIYSMVKFGVSPVINCASTVMLILTVVLMLLAEHLRHRD